MRFSLSDDQQLFARTVREVLDRECSTEALRAAWDGPDGRVPGLWGTLAELGVTGLAVPEEADGLGGDDTDLVAIVEETGRVAMPEPLLSTVVGTGVLAQVGGPAAKEWLPRVAAGEAVLAVGLPTGSYVVDADLADLLLLVDGTELHAVPAGAARVAREPAADSGLRLCRVEWEPGPSTRIAADAAGVLAAAVDRAALLAAAQLVGLAQGMLEMGVRYAQQREQFGRAIGSFQAVKHQLADVFVAVEFARPVVARAAWSSARALPTRARDASTARHAAGEAAALAARVALQVHGGIGYTFENDLHMWLKRVWTLSSVWGDTAWHRRRVAAAVLDVDSPRVP